MIQFSLGRRQFAFGRMFAPHTRNGYRRGWGTDPTIRSYNLGQWGGVAITFRRQAGARKAWRWLLLVVLGAALVGLRAWPAPPAGPTLAPAPPSVIHDFNPEPPSGLGWNGGDLGGGNYEP